MKKASFTSLTPRRDEHFYNEMTDSINGQYYEVMPLSEIPAAPGCQSVTQQNLDQVNHIDASGYLILSNKAEENGENYQTIENLV